MDRSTILKLRTACDLKKLRLSSLEGFVLSQLDGKLTLEEVAEIASLDLDEMTRVANILLLNEAATIVTQSGGVKKGMTEDRSTTTAQRRFDPRAEERSMFPPRNTKKSIAPSPAAAAAAVTTTAKKQRSIIPDPRVETVTIAPKPEPKPEQSPRKSRRSLRMQRPIIPRNSTPPRRTTPPPIIIKSPPPPASAPHRASPISANKPAAVSAKDKEKATRDSEVCELDEATVAKIGALFALVDRVDHYTFLELERGAEKKAIKRAYFAFVSKFHPDRFFGKKLGRERARIERVFEYATAVHDTLTNAAQRAEYDARLPRVSPLPPPPPPTKSKTVPPEVVASPSPPPPSKQPEPPKVIIPRTVSTATQRPIVNKMSKSAMRRASSRHMRAVTAKKPSTASLKKTSTGAAPAAPAASTPAEPPRDRMKNLRNAMMEVKLQNRVDALIVAAEAALKADNVVEAATNYRLALEHRDDPTIRVKFEEVDRFARTIRFEKHMTVARAAERNQQWADAATYLKRAHDAQPSADIADRTAVALRLSGGDLEEAIELAEEAVEREPKNARYHITLGDIYLATSQFEAAEEAAETALELAPKDERAKTLVLAIAKKKKAAK